MHVGGGRVLGLFPLAEMALGSTLSSTHTGEDPNQAPTEIAPSTHVTQEGEAPSIPDTPHFVPDQGDPSPEEPAIGTATRVVAKERMTQTPPLLPG